ncbi:hypothetical protein CONPUDRAFT_180601 [Coniophora puteana RWD-64-598 SS2]|uniref:galacturonan 1,4-alpha-galacturonidase n=1 Tax=Coniophora puteana (strain RWD-64-598) TaxID=741705 RepID=A0A5M3MEY5_CONPW|nr:uncharacterized protein CONPUDRAFT_180601 [Coniophora puteana RWD-64-598 SS2]EIW77480.1 hypothetical protein CONPUDRAFT_180601 [Coniophora puteana RWD-64-598 SS2]
MRPLLYLLVGLIMLPSVAALAATTSRYANTCALSPLGPGRDDTDQVVSAIERCGHGGLTVFEEGEYNITRRMLWNLTSSRVELHGYLSFQPDYEYWLQNSSTYRVVYIQSQASWFVVTGSDFEIDAYNTGGINGNGQPWWEYYTTVPRLGGDGRPLALTVYQAARGTISNFRIEAPPFWCNCIAESSDIVYDGMLCNATNTNPEFYGQNIVPNTDGIDTYRVDNLTLRNWDITSGDDCIAVKGNTTNMLASNVTCRGGNGLAFGSLGQYIDLPDYVENVTMENLHVLRINPEIEPNMMYGVYLKSWSGTVNGTPPDYGGGGTGSVKNVVIRNALLDNVTTPVALYQTSKAYPGDAPSKYQFGNLTFSNFTGTYQQNPLVDIACSPAAPCPDLTFENINVTLLSGGTPVYQCENILGHTGLPGRFNNRVPCLSLCF